MKIFRFFRVPGSRSCAIFGLVVPRLLRMNHFDFNMKADERLVEMQLFLDESSFEANDLIFLRNDLILAMSISELEL